MPIYDPLQEYTGIPLMDAVFGTIGGLIALSFTRVKRVAEALTVIIAGTVCACTLSSPLKHFWDYPPTFHNAVVFFLGLMGMSIVRFAYRFIGRWIRGGALTEQMRKHTEKGE